MSARSIWFTEATDPKLFRCSCGRSECDAPPPSPDLLRVLDALRTAYAHPIIVRSGPRCAFWNSHEGGKADSDHLTGEGADIGCETSSARYALLKILYDLGIRRIGIGETFLHVGVVGAPHPQDVAWTYD